MLYRDPHYANRIALFDLERELSVRLQRREGLAMERMPDETDALQATIDTEAEIASLNHAHQLRLRVRTALERLEEGWYGQCEACERSISTARLNAVPWASRCRSCEEERERSTGPRSKFGLRRPMELQA